MADTFSVSFPLRSAAQVASRLGVSKSRTNRIFKIVAKTTGSKELGQSIRTKRAALGKFSLGMKSKGKARYTQTEEGIRIKPGSITTFSFPIKSQGETRSPRVGAIRIKPGRMGSFSFGKKSSKYARKISQSGQRINAKNAR